MSSTQAGVSSLSASGMWSSVDVAQNKANNSWPAPPMVAGPVSSVEYLVVAGGGGGGGPHPAGGGGGGAGGFISGFLSDSSTQYQVRVGSGGNSNSTGTPSYFGSIISIGGGSSGDGTQNGSPGGSGGGGGGTRGYGGSTSGGFGFNPSTPAPVLSSVPLPSPYSTSLVPS